MTDLAFLVDVDNTLIDNDAAKADLAVHVEDLLGPAGAALFWSAYEGVRSERGVIDLPRTLEGLGPLVPDARAFACLAAVIFGYPYEKCIYPGAREALLHMRTLGTVAIVSDGNPVFQPAKIARAGFVDLVDAVFITTHKEQELRRVIEVLPAALHVLVDDKPTILSSLKRTFGDQVYTLHVCQGHYADDDEHRSAPAPDRTVEHIGDLAHLHREDLMTAGAA